MTGVKSMGFATEVSKGGEFIPVVAKQLCGMPYLDTEWYRFLPTLDSQSEAMGSHDRYSCDYYLCSQLSTIKSVEALWIESPLTWL